MNSGDPSKISKLLRDLYTLDQTNELKGKEREIMEQARKFLVDEITYIRADAKNKVTDDITESLKQMYKKKVQKDRETRKKNAATQL
jgi:RNA polymerase-interacting CarD/CdnL/TRCF family regulator